MVVVSYSGKEINAKLVYYGAGLSGKTTNLEAIYEAVPDTSRGKMVSMKTQSDRTLFFDLLPLDLGEIMGFKTRFLLYTVPGQVFYNATRKLVLKGADAIVFVADSEVGKMEENKESLTNLRTNLAEYNINLDALPWVIQYNKRDLPNVYSLDELNAEMNPGGKVPFFEAVAREGKGVFETFRGISHLLMEKVTKDLRRTPTNQTTMMPRPAMPADPPAAAHAAEPAPAREQVRASAPPVAPVQHIQHEAMSTPAAATGGDESRIDYGREIELPTPSGLMSRISEQSPSPALAAQPAPAPIPVAASVAATPASAPQPVRAAAPAAPAPAPAAATANTHAAAPATRVETAVRVAAPAPAANPAPVTPLIVPIKLSAGGTYEIIIRLEVEPNA